MVDSRTRIKLVEGELIKMLQIIWKIFYTLVLNIFADVAADEIVEKKDKKK